MVAVKHSALSLLEAHGEDSDPQWDGEASTEGSDGGKKEILRNWLLLFQRVWNMSSDNIKIPPEPLGRCFNQLQDKIKKLYERKMKEGMDMNYIIQNKKEFHNPSVYEKLIQFCSIDEIGTNCPKDMFDPHSWSEDSYYEALAKAQKTEMDKLKKAKKEGHSSCSIPVSCSDPRRALGTIPAPLGAGSGLTPSS
uniref:S30BP protein n=1 Tax=Junco hyemalis TaxID=40217 RepID=A0A8C5I8L7_JUNHY